LGDRAKAAVKPKTTKASGDVRGLFICLVPIFKKLKTAKKRYLKRETSYQQAFWF
jgi:hypothetical protein